MIRWEFDKGRAFRNRVRAWRSGFQDLRWAWPWVEQRVAQVHAQLFDTEGHGRWEPLSRMTMQARERNAKMSDVPPYDYLPTSREGPAHRILHWTHTLRNSLANWRGGSLLAVRRYYKKKFVFGTAVEYAAENDLQRPILDVEGSLQATVEVFKGLIRGWLRSSSAEPPRRS